MVLVAFHTVTQARCFCKGETSVGQGFECIEFSRQRCDGVETGSARVLGNVPFLCTLISLDTVKLPNEAQW